KGLRPVLAAVSSQGPPEQIGELLQVAADLAWQTEQLVDQHRLALPLDRYPVDRPRHDAVAGLLVGGLGNQHLGVVILVEALQAAGQVDRVADHRVVQPGRAADVADDYLTRVDADTSPKRWLALCLPALPQFPQQLLIEHRRCTSRQRVPRV